MELYFIGSTWEISHYTMMDRNMWATEVYNWKALTWWINTWSFGWNYQYWNNYGFASILDWSDNPEFPNWETSTAKEIPYRIRINYTWSKFANNEWITSNSWMWGESIDSNIRWWAWDEIWFNWIWGKEDRQWPCPEWYYIPSVSDWSEILVAQRNASLNYDVYSTISSDLILPPIWGRQVRTILDLWIGIVWYWTSSEKGNSAYSISYTKSELELPRTSWRSTGRHVRCLKKSSNKNKLDIHSNSWKNVIIAFTWDVWEWRITSLSEPIRDSGTFWWWYSDENYTNQIHKWDIVPANLYAKWECESGYVDNGEKCVEWIIIKFDSNWWNNKNEKIVFQLGWIIYLPIPTKQWYNFLWRTDSNGNIYTDSISWNEDFLLNDCLILTASWWTSNNSWNNYSWGWKRTKSVDKSENYNSDAHNSADIITDSKTNWNSKFNNNYSDLDIEKYDSKYSFEQNESYQFAYANGITTQTTISNADINWKLTRIQMAKMLSQYAINVLWQELDLSKWAIEFKDITKELDEKYDCWVTLAYQLWIMWINMKNNKFRPYDEVTRAEFATALSRLLYKTDDWEFKWTWRYYQPHISKLYNEWIINNTNPKLKELRGYVMIMLMRSSK